MLVIKKSLYIFLHLFLLDPSKTFSDDSRLSRLMRRLLKESDRDRRLNAAKQLKDYLRSSDGVKVNVLTNLYSC